MKLNIRGIAQKLGSGSMKIGTKIFVLVGFLMFLLFMIAGTSVWQTAQATEEITRHIEAVQAATQQAVVSMDSIGNVIAEVEEISSSFAAAMEEQGTAT